jgi:hypothetical protein
MNDETCSGKRKEEIMKPFFRLTHYSHVQTQWHSTSIGFNHRLIFTNDGEFSNKTEQDVPIYPCSNYK